MIRQDSFDFDEKPLYLPFKSSLNPVNYMQQEAEEISMRRKNSERSSSQADETFPNYFSTIQNRIENSSRMYDSEQFFSEAGKISIESCLLKSSQEVEETIKRKKKPEYNLLEEIFNQPQAILFENPFDNNKYQVPELESQWLTLQNRDSKNFQDLQCLICAQNFPVQEKYTLTNCQHTLHKPCLKQLLEFDMKTRKFPSQCPHENCSRAVSLFDVRSLLHEKFQRYEKLKEKAYVDAHSHLYFFCQTPDCEAYVQKSKLISSFYKCIKCESEYCTSCSKPWHYGPCQLREQDTEFLKYAKKKLYKTCPKCRKLVEKISGCHHIICVCKYQFCYICQKDYRNECQCKHLSFGQHRTLMAIQRKQQKQLAKKEEKERRAQERALKKQQMQEEKQKQKQKRQEQLQKKKLQNKAKKGKRNKLLIIQQKEGIRKTRKMVKRDYFEEY